MLRSVDLIVILNKTGNHSVNIAPTECYDLSQVQKFLTALGSDEKIVDFFSIRESESDDPGFGMFLQLLSMDTTRETIESILTTAFLQGLRIPHDVAFGLA